MRMLMSAQPRMLSHAQLFMRLLGSDRILKLANHLFSQSLVFIFWSFILMYSSCVLVLFFEVASKVPQAPTEFALLLPQLQKCWDYRCVSPCPTEWIIANKWESCMESCFTVENLAIWIVLLRLCVSLFLETGG